MMKPLSLNLRSAIKRLSMLVLCLIATLQPLRAQTVDLGLQNLPNEELARGFLEPLIEGIGYAGNSGLTYGAKIEKGFHMHFGIRGMWTLIPDDRRTYVAHVSDDLVARAGYPSEITTATAVGSTGAILESRSPAYPSFKMPDGLVTRKVYLFLLDFSIGSVFATEIMFRGIPLVQFDPAVGKIGFFGMGLRHNFTQYLKSKVDVSLLVMGQYMTIGDAITDQSYNVQLQGSYDISNITLYSAVGYEGYDITVKYTYEPIEANLPPGLDEPLDVSMDFRRENIRFTLGAAIRLLPVLTAMADYSFGVMDNMTVGLAFKF